MGGDRRMRTEKNVKENRNVGHKHIISICVMPVIEKVHHISEPLDVTSL